jgi:predicted secreted protein
MGLREIVPLAALLLAGGCSTTQWDEMRANPRDYFNLTPPTLFADAGIEGRQVTLHRWQALVVHLDEDTSVADRWQMQPLASTTVIAPVLHDLVNKPTEAPAPSYAAGEAIFRLRGVAPGTQPFVLELKRPFETTATGTIRFDVVVR